MVSEVKIYGLVSPDIPEKIRYVGKTKNAIRTRLNEHWCSRKKGTTPVAYWIKSLEQKGLKPQIKLLDMCSENYWEKYEKFYISYFKNNELVNYEPGGKSTKVFKAYRKKNTDTRKKIVLQFNLNTGELLNEFTSCVEAGKELKLNSSVIAFACRGIQKMAYNFHWEYKNEKWISKLVGKPYKKVYKKDLQNNIINIYNSVGEAANDICYSKSHTSKFCRLEKTIDNFKLSYRP